MTTEHANPLAGTRLAFIGAGVMAESMIAGILKQGQAAPQQIVASHPRPERLGRLEKRFGIDTASDNRIAATGADLVFLTIKPQVLQTVMPQLAGHLQPEQVVISVLAGAPVDVLTRGLQHQAVARVMPNTPAQVGEGMSVWCTTPGVSSEQQARVQAALGALGRELWVEEEKYVDMATALSGTGPTYVFLMMEALIDAGVHMGFPRRIAEQLVTETILGSVSYYQKNGIHPAQLRNQVTSPGGTSAEALYFLEKAGFRTAISRAIWAAYERSQELGRGLNSRDPEK